MSSPLLSEMDHRVLQRNPSRSGLVEKIIKSAIALWRRLPPNFRRRLRAPIQKVVLDAWATPAPRKGNAVGGPLSLIGLLTATSGLGEGARLQLAMLHHLGFDPISVDVAPVIIPDHDKLPDSNYGGSAIAGRGGVALLHINPPELPLAVTMAKLHRDTYRIGYWACELETPPLDWQSARRLVNEVWVPSQFCAEAIRRIMDIPVHVLHPIARIIPRSREMSRFVDPESKFTALFAYDVNSSHARKNPEAAIGAFRLGLEGQPSARMLIKVSNLDRYPTAARMLAGAIGGDSRISLVKERLSSSDMTALIESADVILSLHRSEGFGSLLAQAMLVGKPVIATDWSGNVDFMDRSNSFPVPFQLVPVSDPQGIYREGRWAEPDVSTAAQYLRLCYENGALRRSIGANALKSASLKFGPSLEHAYRERIEALRLVRVPTPVE